MSGYENDEYFNDGDENEVDVEDEDKNEDRYKEDLS